MPFPPFLPVVAVGAGTSSSSPAAVARAALAALQDQLLALPPSGSPSTGNNNPNPASSSLTGAARMAEADRRADAAVKAHFELLHRYNEVKDAVENMIEKYVGMTGRTVEDVKDEIGLSKDD